MGEYDQAIQKLLEILKLEPYHSFARAHLARAYVCKEMYEEAVIEAQKAINICDSAVEKRALGESYAMAGDREKALQVLENLLEYDHDKGFAMQAIAVIYSAIGEKDKAFEWLVNAYNARAEFLLFLLKSDPGLKTLRSDSRFKTLLKKVNIES